MSAKLHFRPHINNQLELFPQRIDEDIAPNDPVRLVNSVVDGLDLERFRKLYRERGRSPYHQAVQGAWPQSLPPEDDAQGDHLRLHEQHLLVPQGIPRGT